MKPCMILLHRCDGREVYLNAVSIWKVWYSKQDNCTAVESWFNDTMYVVETKEDVVAAIKEAAE